MINIEENELAIQSIDTTKVIRPIPRELVDAIVEIQEKVNEIIELVNVLTLPDDEEAMEGENEDEDGEVIGRPVPKPSKK